MKGLIFYRAGLNLSSAEIQRFFLRI